MSTIFFIFAIVLVCIAHLVRISRWKMFIEIYEKPKTQSLIQALALGYSLNYIFPFKLGDIIRALFAGYTMKNKFSLALSTVFMDRYLDVIAVGLMFIAFSIFNIKDKILLDTSKFYIMAAAGLFILTVTIYFAKKHFKKFFVLIARIFNKKIELTILVFIWALVWNFKDIFLKINKTKLILKTVIMWGLYLSSYIFFAKFLNNTVKNTSFLDVFKTLFNQHNILSNVFSAEFNQESKLLICWSAYLLLSIFLTLLISFFYKNDEVDDNKDYLNLIPQINFHSLRHTFATKCIYSGMDVKSLSEILGHSSASITMQVYVHPSIETKREQLDKAI